MTQNAIHLDEINLDLGQQAGDNQDLVGSLYLDDATRTPGDVIPKDSIGFGRGRQSLDRSVWYNGWLLTFLATGEDTHGQFA